MGQRLVISVFANSGDSDPIATYYYHWSAYTISAAEEVKELLSKIGDWEAKHGVKLADLTEKDAKLALVHIGETLNVAPEEDAEAFKKMVEAEEPEGIAKTAMLEMIGRRLIGGGPGTEEIERLKKLYPGESFKAGDRDYGLVDITPEGMNESLHWAEGGARINLNSKTFSVYCTAFIDPKEWEDGYGNWNDQKLDELPAINYDPSDVHKFNEIDKYIADLKSLPETYFNKAKNLVVQQIC